MSAAERIQSGAFGTAPVTDERMRALRYLASLLIGACMALMLAAAAAPGAALASTSGFSSLSAGFWHTCAVQASDSTVLCWGDDDYGETDVPAALGAVTQVSAGVQHTCAIQASDSTVLCWGLDNYAQTDVPAGLGAVSQLSAGAYDTCAVRASDSSVICWGWNYHGKTDVPAGLGAVKQISAGDNDNCALKASDGTVSCWGQNAYGETDVPAGLGAVTQISVGGYHVCAVRASDSTVLCWGDDDYGETDVPAALGAVTQVSAGAFHTCAVKASDSTVLCWGNGYEGAADVPAALGAVTQISAGAYDTCALKASNGALACWGDNTYGQDGGVLLSPTNTRSEVGSAHYLGALVYDSAGNPQAGVSVTLKVLSGPRAGDTFTAVTDASGKASFSYSSSATGTDKLQASFTDGTGSRTSNTITQEWVPAPPTNTAPPTISGQATQGQTLSARQGTWDGDASSYTYQWQRCDHSGANCVNIDGAQRQQYTVLADDVGYTLRVQETASNPAGSGSPAPSAITEVVLPLAPQVLTAPSISGNAVQGQTLSESNGTWSNHPTAYSYEWERCELSGDSCQPISGASSQTYTLTAAEVGHAIRVRETARNAGGDSAGAGSSASTAVTGLPPSDISPPAISGSAKQGQTLTEAHGNWTSNPTVYRYQWEDCSGAGDGCHAIAGASAHSYTLRSSDVGHTIRVRESAFNAWGESSPSASTATAAIAAVSPPPTIPPANTALPVITGKTRLKAKLSVTRGAWKGSSPMSYSDRWRSCDGKLKEGKPQHCKAIAGARGSSFTVSKKNVGHRLDVVLTAANAAGKASATSKPTGIVKR
jgi:hypothetical protein